MEPDFVLASTTLAPNSILSTQPKVAKLLLMFKIDPTIKLNLQLPAVCLITPNPLLTRCPQGAIPVLVDSKNGTIYLLLLPIILLITPETILTASPEDTGLIFIDSTNIFSNFWLLLPSLES